MSKLRVIFAGTPHFASAHLEALLGSDHEVIAVYTQPDRPSGRGQKLMPSPVKAVALANDIPVFQPKTLRDEAAQQELAALNADVMVVVAYGLILPKAVLDAPKNGCLNVHGSILPRWRGAAPIQRAIAEGDTESGVTIMQMDEGLDTGDMLIKAHCPILPTDTASDLHDRLIELGRPALVQALDQMAAGTLQPEKQDDALANYAHKLSKEEGVLDWNKSAVELDRMVRGFNPAPVASTVVDDAVMRVWRAEPIEQNHNEQPGTLLAAGKPGLDVACGEGVLRLTNVQLPGSRAMNVQDLLNSKKSLFTVGKVLG